jgi:MORN repeat variant
MFKQLKFVDVVWSACYIYHIAAHCYRLNKGKNMTTLNLQDCEALFAAAIKRKACKGNADAARRYLDAGDVEGFERVCRGNYDWLRYNGIAYVLTDGAAENWDDNGQMRVQSQYVNGDRHGKCMRWHANGQVCRQANYINGRLHGECTWWYVNGQMREQSIYFDGQLHGECTCWYHDGQMCEQANYANGVKQP